MSSQHSLLSIGQFIFTNIIIIYISQFQELSDKFLSGEIQLEKFLEEFKEERKMSYLRKAKAEKMTKILSLRQSSCDPVDETEDIYVNAQW